MVSIQEEMFYNFVKMISYVGVLGSAFHGPDRPTDASHSHNNTAAFRPLLLFRLHDNSHRALTLFLLFSASHQYLVEGVAFLKALFVHCV